MKGLGQCVCGSISPLYLVVFYNWLVITKFEWAGFCFFRRTFTILDLCKVMFYWGISENDRMYRIQLAKCKVEGCIPIAFWFSSTAFILWRLIISSVSTKKMFSPTNWKLSTFCRFCHSLSTFNFRLKLNAMKTEWCLVFTPINNCKWCSPVLVEFPMLTTSMQIWRFTIFVGGFWPQSVHRAFYVMVTSVTRYWLWLGAKSAHECRSIKGDALSNLTTPLVSFRIND